MDTLYDLQDDHKDVVQTDKEKCKHENLMFRGDDGQQAEKEVGR